MHAFQRENIAADRRNRALAAAVLRRRVTVRPVELADVETLDRMFRRLSPETIRFRFFSPLTHVPRSALLRLAVVDHSRDEALIALDGDEIVGIAGYNGLPDAGHDGTRDAELAVAVDDEWQRRGVGRLLTRRLATVALARGCDAFVVRILPDNRGALQLLRALVPDAEVRFSDGEYGARLPLRARIEPGRHRVRIHGGLAQVRLPLPPRMLRMHAPPAQHCKDSASGRGGFRSCNP